MGTRIDAVVNVATTLRYQFAVDGVVSDIYQWDRIEIYDTDPRLTPLAVPIQTILPSAITRIGVGLYQYEMNAVSNPGMYYDKQYFIPLQGYNLITDMASVSVLAFVGSTTSLKGYAYNNPDTAANNGWGAIVTPDELRWHYMWGMPMTSPEGQIWMDEQLQMYIDNAIAMLERELNFSIMPKKYRHRPFGQFNPDTQDTRTDLNPTWIPGIDFQWDEPYDFDRKAFNNFINIKLRHRPLLRLEKVLFKDALGQPIADITTWSKPNYRMGSLEFFPHSGALANMPLFAGSPFFVSQAPQAIDNYPDAFFIDYDAGVRSAEHLRREYPELFQIVAIIAALLFMPDYSEGRISGIASSSLGLEGVSESYSTTASAENTILSAKMRHYGDKLKDFLKNNRTKYAGIQLIAL